MVARSWSQSAGLRAKWVWQIFLTSLMAAVVSSSVKTSAKRLAAPTRAEVVFKKLSGAAAGLWWHSIGVARSAGSFHSRARRPETWAWVRSKDFCSAAARWAWEETDF